MQLTVSSSTPKCRVHASWCSFAFAASNGALAGGGVFRNLELGFMNSEFNLTERQRSNYETFQG